MNYTGERMLPGASDPATLWEHIYRYAFAARFAGGKRVLDVACGAGYGSAALRRAGARSVIGIDNSPEACAFAAREYGVDARVGDAESLSLPDAAFDLVVSFETIEHLEHPLRFLDECRRVMAPGATAIISTPNKSCYRQLTPNNPFHAHELERDEFEQECRRRFRQVGLFSQRPFHARWWSPRGAASLFWPLLRVPGMAAARRRLARALYPHLSEPGVTIARQQPIDTILSLRSQRTTFGNPYAIRKNSGRRLDDPVYLIALCSAE